MKTNCLNVLLDKNGKQIEYLGSVIVPDPNESDVHYHSFVGIVVDLLDNGNVIVEDQDSDFFEIEANKLVVI